MSAHRRYALISFLTWLPTGLYLPVMVLLMLDQGLSLPAIAGVGLFYSITVAVLELPTGGLADVLGRRPVLIASALASLAGLLMLGLANTVTLFAISAPLRGVARALGSGPAEAWYVDTVHASEGVTADLGPGLARGSAASSWALTVGTLAGGLIPLALADVVPSALAIPVLLAAAIEAVRLFVLYFGLPEQRPARVGLGHVLRGVPINMRDGMRIARREGVVARILLVSGALGVALATIELLTPAWLATLTGTLETAGIAYALVAAFGFAASALGASLSHRLICSAGRSRAARLGLLVMAAALAGFGATTLLSGVTGVVVAGCAYFVIFAGLGAANPALSSMLHDRVEAAQRATVISMQSLSLMVFGAAGVLGFAWMAAEVGPGWAIAVAAVVMAASAIASPPRVATIARQTDMPELLAKLNS